MNRELMPTQHRPHDCHLVSLMQTLCGVSFMLALYSAIAHQGEVPATLYVIWVAATAVLGIVTLAFSSICAQARGVADDEQR